MKGLLNARSCKMRGATLTVLSHALILSMATVAAAAFLCGSPSGSSFRGVGHRGKARQGMLRLLSSQTSRATSGGVEDFARDPLWQERSSKWILLVDDEEAIRKAVGQLLFEKGFQVTACGDALTALDIATSRKVENSHKNSTDASSTPQSVLPNVIVSDIRMPGMDGLELLQKIRSDPVLVQVPVVLLTAKGMTEDRIQGYDAGADAYLPKPFDPAELVAVIDHVIERHEQLSSQDKTAQGVVEDLKRDLDEIKYLLLQSGGGGIGNGWVAADNVFLAPDEREVLELLCQGLMNKEIAQQTFLSKRRVEQLLTSMFRKAGVKNRTELVRWAVSKGHVQL